MGEPAGLGTAAAQPATGPTTSSRIDTATAARAAAPMGTTTGPAATNATAVGRTTSAAAPPQPPLVPERADHHPLGGCRSVVPAWPSGADRQATDSTRQHRRSPGGLDDHRPSHDSGSHYRRPNNDDPTNHDPTNDGAANNDPPADDGPSGCTDAPATTSARPPRTTAAPSLCGAPANPYGYNFCGRGSLITNPASDVCVYFDCIPNFDNGTGYMVECHDAMYSMSGGRQGAWFLS
jgi:hypothetical protein